LGAALERNAASLGDAVGDTETAAFEELLSTPPTSMAGVDELLNYLLLEVDDIHHRLGDPAVSVLTSIADTLVEIRPVA
jgi:hypothetical protein